MLFMNCLTTADAKSQLCVPFTGTVPCACCLLQVPGCGWRRGDRGRGRLPDVQPLRRAAAEENLSSSIATADAKKNGAIISQRPA